LTLWNLETDHEARQSEQATKKSKISCHHHGKFGSLPCLEILWRGNKLVFAVKTYGHVKNSQIIDLPFMACSLEIKGLLALDSG
jgi:hypothetical protein